MSAAAYSQFVYGAANEQTNTAGSNIIALKHNPVEYKAGGASKRRRRRGLKSKGGVVFSDVIVPAALLYANNTLGRRSKSRSRGSRKRGSRKYRR
jgi:hypothetical protein